MYNWSVNTEFLRKYPGKYKIWELEQLINFGLNGEKLDQITLRKYIDKLAIDPAKKRFLKFLLKDDKQAKNPIKRSG